jgi:hypothetical protein
MANGVAINPNNMAEWATASNERYDERMETGRY